MDTRCSYECTPDKFEVSSPEPCAAWPGGLGCDDYQRHAIALILTLGPTKIRRDCCWGCGGCGCGCGICGGCCCSSAASLMHAESLRQAGARNPANVSLSYPT